MSGKLFEFISTRPVCEPPIQETTQVSLPPESRSDSDV